MKSKTIFALLCVLIVSLAFFLPNFRMYINNNLANIAGSFRSVLFKNNTVIAQEEVGALQAQVATLVQENRYLENELGLRSTEQKRVPIRLLVEKSLVYNTTSVDVSEVQVSAGLYVYAQNNVVAGTIQEISGNKAKISFLGSNEKFLAEIVSTGEIIELTGNGIGYYTGSVPKSTTLTIGDTIALKGYPQSIVGTITSVEDDGTSVSKVWVRSPINLSKSKIFYVDQN